MTDDTYIDNDFAALIENDVSAEFRGLMQELESLKEMAPEGHQARFQRDLDELQKLLLTYSYKDRCFELAILLAVLSHVFGDVGEVLWVVDDLDADRVRKAIDAAGIDDHCTVNGGSIEIDNGEEVLALHLSRCRSLALWINFLLSARINLHDDLDTFAEMVWRDDVKAVSNRIQRDLAKWLVEHYQPRHRYSQAMAMFNWLRRDQDREATFDQIEQLLTDDAVLGYWAFGIGNLDVEQESELAAEEDEQGKRSNRRFTTVGELAFSLLARIQSGRSVWQAVRTTSGTTADEDGEAIFDNLAGYHLEPDDLEQELGEGLQAWAVETEGEHTGRLTDELESWPADIKFLMNTEIDRARRTIDRESPLIARLPLTQIRMGLFGGHQSKISGELKKPRSKLVPALVDCSSMQNATDWLAELDALAARIDRSRHAVWHVILSCDPDLEREAPIEAAAGREAFLARCKAAFREIRRDGFNSLPEDTELHRYHDGLAVLEGLYQRYLTVKEAAVPYDSEARFEPDRAFFADQFRRLYAKHLQSEAMTQ